MKQTPGQPIGFWMVGITAVSLALVCGLVLWQPNPSVVLPALALIAVAASLVAWRVFNNTLLQFANGHPGGFDQTSMDQQGALDALEKLIQSFENGQPLPSAQGIKGPVAPLVAGLHKMLTAMVGEGTQAGRDAIQIQRGVTDLSEGAEALSTGSKKQMATVTEVSRRLQVLSSRCEEVAQTVEVLDDLARQTNVLALNAALEASRAGTSGKGFAIVAEEVRKLAERSSGATRDVNAIVQAMDASANEAVRLLDDISALAQHVAQQGQETRDTAATLQVHTTHMRQMLRAKAPSVTLPLERDVKKALNNPGLSTAQALAKILPLVQDSTQVAETVEALLALSTGDTQDESDIEDSASTPSTSAQSSTELDAALSDLAMPRA